MAFSAASAVAAAAAAAAAMTSEASLRLANVTPT